MYDADRGRGGDRDPAVRAGAPPGREHRLPGTPIHRYASEPIVEALKLFRRVALTWWTGNGDMHLKNFALLRGADGLYRLSPAYDLLCTSLLIADEQLALPVGGNRREVTPQQWAEFAAYCRLTSKAAARVLSELRHSLDPAVRLIERSTLPPDMQERYVELLRARAPLLERAARKGSAVNH